MRGWVLAGRIAIVLLAATALVFVFVRRGRGREVEARRTPDAAGQFETSGCGAVHVVRAVRQCLVVPGERFRIVVPPGRSAEHATVLFDGRPLAPRASSARVLELAVDRHGVLDITAGDDRGAIVIGRLERPRWYDEASRARAEGNLERTERHASEGLASASPEDHALAKGLLARVALRRGDLARAEALFRESIALGKENGLVSESVDDAFALSFLLHQRTRRFKAARTVLDGIVTELYADGKARLPFYRAQLAWELGDMRGALRLLDDARERAETIGHASLARAVRHVRSMVLCHSGSLADCTTELAAAERELDGIPGTTPCERVEVAVSLGFAEVATALLRRNAPPELGAADERALSVAACPDRHLRGIALEHLALAHALKKNVREARASLAEAKQTISDPRLSDTLLWADIEGWLALADGSLEGALAAFDREEALARASGRNKEIWRARVGRADALEARGRSKEAVEAHLEAERSLDDHLLVVPLGDGRTAVAAETRWVTMRAVDLALRVGDDRAGLLLARMARARTVRSVARGLGMAELSSSPELTTALEAFRAARDELDREAAADWKLSAATLARVTSERKVRLERLDAQLDEALSIVGSKARTNTFEHEPHLAPGELGLLYTELPRGLAAFAFDATGVAATRIEHAEPEALLAPHRAKIADARAIRVLASGPVAGVDFHALAFDGAPLVAHASVVYPVDLGEPRAVAEHTGGPTLVVADPTDDLPGARAEGRAVATRAAGGPGGVVVLEGHEATSQRVREALTSARALFYSGHGSFEGRAGTDSHLPLADHGALMLADILALREPPSLVVLSGCETARASDARDQSFGLAHAFVLAGTRSVIAPTRVVADTLARAIVQGFVDAPVDLTPEEKLRWSQLRARDRRLTGWEGFRAIVR